MSDLMSKINSNGDTQAESHMSDLCDRNPLELKQDYLSDPSRIGSFKHIMHCPLVSNKREYVRTTILGKQTVYTTMSEESYYVDIYK